MPLGLSPSALAEKRRTCGWHYWALEYSLRPLPRPPPHTLTIPRPFECTPHPLPTYSLYPLLRSPLQMRTIPGAFESMPRLSTSLSPPEYALTSLPTIIPKPVSSYFPKVPLKSTFFTYQVGGDREKTCFSSLFELPLLQMLASISGPVRPVGFRRSLWRAEVTAPEFGSVTLAPGRGLVRPWL